MRYLALLYVKYWGEFQGLVKDDIICIPCFSLYETENKLSRSRAIPVQTVHCYFTNHLDMVWIGHSLIIDNIIRCLLQDLICWFQTELLSCTGFYSIQINGGRGIALVIFVLFLCLRHFWSGNGRNKFRNGWVYDMDICTTNLSVFAKYGSIFPFPNSGIWSGGCSKACRRGWIRHVPRLVSLGHRHSLQCRCLIINFF